MLPETHDHHYLCNACKAVVASTTPATECPRCKGPLMDAPSDDDLAVAVADRVLEAAPAAHAFAVAAVTKFSKPAVAVLAHLLAAKLIMRTTELPGDFALFEPVVDAALESLQIYPDPKAAQ